MSIPTLGSAWLFAAVTSGAQLAQSAIPYRNAPAVSTGSLAMAMTITLLALMALVGGLAYARRRGWTIGSRPGARGMAAEGIEVKASRRLSMATTTHVIAYRGAEYLVVETVRGTVATVTPLSRLPTGPGGTP
ncbi:hypothetical protein ACVCL3_02740 [Rhodanobacter sp. UC4437_H4]